MINKFVKIWDEHKQDLIDKYSKKHPKNYEEIFKDVITLLHTHKPNDGDDYPNPEDITMIRRGSYSGTILFIVTNNCSFVPEFWSCLRSYGSCCGCDTFEMIAPFADDNDLPTEQHVADYMTLALHLLQSIKEVV